MYTMVADDRAEKKEASFQSYARRVGHALRSKASMTIVLKVVG